MIWWLVVLISCQFARADVVFLVDSSQSICAGDSSCSDWQSVLSFIIAVINRLNVATDRVRVGFIRYASPSATSNEFYLNSNHFDRTQVTNAVWRVQYNTGRRFVGDLAYALSVARTQQFVSNRGDRIGAPNIIIVLTNGGISATSSAVSFHLLLQ